MFQKKLFILAILLNFISKIKDIKTSSVYDLSYQRIKTIDTLKNNTSKLNVITQLLLNNNRLKKIPSNAFSNFPHLELLNLNRNHIHELESESFYDLNRLKTLLLNDNHLIHLPTGIFFNLIHLEHLDLSDNEIKFVDSLNMPFLNLFSLKTLDLSSNDLHHIYSFTFVNLINLEKLSLKNTNLKSIESKALDYAFDRCLKETLINLNENLLVDLNQIQEGKCFKIESSTQNTTTVTSTIQIETITYSETKQKSEYTSTLSEIDLLEDTIITNPVFSTTTSVIQTSLKNDLLDIYLDEEEEKGYLLDLFYKFGAKSGDDMMPNIDDFFIGPIYLKSEFTYMDKTYSSLYIHSDGFISFENPASLKHDPQKRLPLICPFKSDINTEIGGAIYHRQQTVNLTQLATDIHTIDKNFEPNWGFIITWYQVASLDGDPLVNNTFQVALTTNQTTSFVVLNYGRLMWSRVGYLKTKVGFITGDNENLYIMDSLSSDFDLISLEKSTNVKQFGKNIFRVDSNVDFKFHLANKNDTDNLRKQIYRFGIENHDRLVPKNDDGYFGPIDFIFPFYSKLYTAMFIHTNGYIAFDLPNSLPSDAGRFAPPTSVPLVYPFYSDINTEISGQIYYRYLYKDFTTEEIKRTINDTSFDPLASLLVTWSQVVPFNSENTLVNNTFQCVLTTNGSHSYVIYNYYDINWPNKDSKISVKMGIDAGDNETLINLSSVNLLNQYVINTGQTVEKINFAKEERETVTDLVYPPNCMSLYLKSDRKKSNEYSIFPTRNMSFSLRVYCEMKNLGGWVRIMNRIDSTNDFNRTYQEYINGFGSLYSNYWIGLSNLYYLTKLKQMMIRIELYNYDQEMQFVEYKKFQIGSESSGYELIIDERSSENLIDDILYQNGTKFSTRDQDNDLELNDNLAKKFNGGWWHTYNFANCFTCNCRNFDDDDNEYKWFMREACRNFKYDYYAQIKMLIKPFN